MSGSVTVGAVPMGPVLVTGGCGFIGSHLVDEILASDPTCQVHVVDINTTRNRLHDPRVTYHTGDIANLSDVEAAMFAARPRTIFHVACPDSMVTLDVSVFQKVNIDGARNLLKIAEKVGTVQAFVNTSTSSVIHDNISDLIDADENLPVLQYPAQKRVYTLTKAEAEAEILAANRKHGDSSMLAVSMRPATAFGERDTICMGKIVSTCRQGKGRFQIGSGNNQYDFIYIGNLVDAHLLAAYALLRAYGKPAPPKETRVDGEAFNVTNDERILFWEFHRCISASVGLPIKQEDIKIVPKWLALFMAMISEYSTWIRSWGTQQPTVTREAVRLTTIERTLNGEKAKRLLGYKPKEQRNVAMVEYPTLLGRWLGGLRYLWAGPEITLRAYKTNIPFGVRTPETYYVHLLSEEHIKQLEKAPEEYLSLHALSKDMFQPKYTMSGLEVQDKMNSNGVLHTRVLRIILPSHLPHLLGPLSEIITRTFLQQIHVHRKPLALSLDAKQYVALPMFEMAKTVITAANSRAFFGPDLSSNAEFLSAAQSYPEDLLSTAEVLRLTPSFMGRWLAPILMRNHCASKTLVRFLTPLVEERLSLRQKRLVRGAQGQILSHNDYCRRGKDACDIIQFFVDANHDKSSSPPWSATKIVQVILGIWFAAVHQPAMSIVYALQDLLDHPEYLEPLRHELIAHPMEDLDRNPLLDSFLKESSRLHPSDAISVRRKVLEPFTFPDGTHLRAGDVACVPSQAIMQDPAYYGMDSLAFDAFRFVNTEGGSVARFTDASPTYPLWGLGKHSCPGRFYASLVLKIFLAHIIMNYDFKQPTQPSSVPFFGQQNSFYFRSAIVPRAGTKLQLRERERRI
ncbi:hypothetical protein G7Y89_g6465 [Cudoniella acicularis]|uniref:3-beta hydroxysteroid dehydrogenase/isomerase domain-containing protein n=1 Tax=Cudoniella acicularis TaxID=354080 RepID=A0A8H4W2U7_9HELO|nr:hypothetical protein G7Y89_g6465 [Cudoniella acicularis]